MTVLGNGWRSSMIARIKIFIVVSLIFGVSMGVNTAVHLQLLYRERQESLQRFSGVLARELANEIVVAYQAEHPRPPHLDELISRCLELHTTHADNGITHVAIISPAETIIAHSQSELAGTPITDQQILDQVRRRQPTTILTEHIYHTLLPVFDSGQHIYRATVDIGIAQQTVDDRLWQAMAQSIPVGLYCVAGAAVVLLVLFHLGVTRPLRTLTRFGKEIAGGNTSSPEPRLLKVHIDIQGVRDAFQAIREYVERMAHLTHEMACGNIQQQIRPCSENDSLGHALQQMSDYLSAISVAAAAIVAGDLHQDFVPQGPHDKLGQAFTKIQEYLRRFSGLAHQIADGNIENDVMLESSEDGLYAALSRLTTYLREAVGVAQNIAENNLHVVVNVRSQQDQLNLAFQRLVMELQASKERLEHSMTHIQQQNWLRTGLAELSDVMRGEQDVNTLSNRIITYLAKYLQAQVGAFYVLDDRNGKPLYRLSGTYAYSSAHASTEKPVSDMAFEPGEGLIGQAVESQKPLFITDIPAGHLAIRMGLGQAEPRQILVIPCLYEQTVPGVIEVGTASEFTSTQQELLAQVQENIAITMHTARSRVEMQHLLTRTQQQSQELLQQQDSLRQTNVDLEHQARALQDSEEKLRIQQEELRQTNEELEHQTMMLARQKRELNEKNAELERARRMMAEKAEALERSQVLLERKMQQLERAEKYKAEFLANMSHELRTPLNSLLILARLLSENKEGNLSPKQQEFARTIYIAGADLLNLINEVLDLSKVETGKMILNIEQMTLSNLAAYITQHFSHMAREKGLYLHINIADDVPVAITTDRQRVEQIIKNLVANALKFTEKGGIWVHVSRPDSDMILSEPPDQPHPCVAIAVSDTGIGIPEGQQQMIFEAFQQADSTISGRYGGTGLGLSISREFAKLLGGQILVTSKEGKGSTFTLVLPGRFKSQADQRAKSPDVALSAEALPVLQEPPPQISLDSIETIRDDRHDITPEDKTLLIIENDPQFAKQVFDLARERGFRGLVAGDGEAGLQLAFQYRPSAIILNITLPRINGWVVTEKLRRNPETRHIPIHFTSRKGQNHASMPAGAIGYMTRPVVEDELEDALLLIESTMTFSFKKLLVVAENQSTRKRLLESFQESELEICAVSTAQEAYARVKGEAFDGIVLEIGLRNMSSFDFIELIHRDPLVSYLPIITYRTRDLTSEEQQRLQGLLTRTLSHSAPVQEHVAPENEQVFDEIMLFLHQVEAELPETRQRQVRMLHDRETVFREKTILLVDDDMRNLYALTSTLEDHQMSVLMAVNGEEALKILREHGSTIHLVMMDMMMPQMDGYEAIRTIRQNPDFRRLPIIALTARAMRGDRQKCIEAGANDYLSKPVDIDKLLSLLRVWLY